MGTWLDVELMSVLTIPGRDKLSDFWGKWDPKGDKTGQGYIRSAASSQKSVDFIGSLKVFMEPEDDGFSINYSSLKTYA